MGEEGRLREVPVGSEEGRAAGTAPEPGGGWRGCSWAEEGEDPAPGAGFLLRPPRSAGDGFSAEAFVSN